MARMKCIGCGNVIIKSGLKDPYICRDCEKLIMETGMSERYGYLDNH
ncbi:MAG TPA: hypothetical protein VJJ52_01440 [Candidatus Nanoarchaeia archaeon]|nr:hypothetical protein [Candidatus Nanoarchaeia archaeon]